MSVQCTDSYPSEAVTDTEICSHEWIFFYSEALFLRTILQKCAFFNLNSRVQLEKLQPGGVSFQLCEEYLLSIDPEVFKSFFEVFGYKLQVTSYKLQVKNQFK